MTETDLPHETYMAAVAAALTTYGCTPTRWEAGADDSGDPDLDGQLLTAVFGGWPDGAVDPDEWLNGVYLTWDQYRGWQLVEDGGGRNVRGLSEESSGVYCAPQQVAADTAARLAHGPTGWTPGPICITGDRWDTAATQAAVEAWEAAQ